MTDDLTMPPTVIGGETPPDDYEVIWDGLSIGRIFRSVGVGGIDGWSWAVILPNVPSAASIAGAPAALTKPRPASEPHGSCTTRSATTRSGRRARSRAGAGLGTGGRATNFYLTALRPSAGKYPRVVFSWGRLLGLDMQHV